MSAATAIDEASLRAALARATGRPRKAPVVVYAVTGSTNDDAKVLARDGAPPGTIVVADAQSQGRGRSGATWHSPPGENVYLSVLLRPVIAPALVAPLTLVAGLVVRDAAQARVSLPVQLKWPNDVLVGGRKLAGILIEGQVRGDKLAGLVVGVGINVGARSFPEPIDRIATSLAALGASDLDRCALVAQVVHELEVAAERFERDGFAGFADRIAAHDALLNRTITVGDVRGVARGIDEQGRLLLGLPDGTVQAVVSGHVDVSPSG